MTSKKPDFKKANIMANEILAASSTLVTFPINTKKLVREWSDIQLHSFRYAEERGVDIQAFGSKSAVLQCKNGRYIIFYNKDEIAERVRFSISHEFGHYRFGHKLTNYKDKEEYECVEVEANCFAAQLLMPEQVIHELQRRGAVCDKDFLINNFFVSSEAADKRIETMNKYNFEWRSEKEKFFDETILYKYSDFMNSILPKVNKYNMYEVELDKEIERDKWDFDTRTRYR